MKGKDTPNSAQRGQSDTSQDAAHSSQERSHVEDSFDPIQSVLSFGGKPAIIKKVVEIFVEKTPGQIEVIKEALDLGDFESVVRLAHSLKGAAACICATRFQELAIRMEKAGRNKATQEIDHLAGKLMEEIQLLREAKDKVDWDSLPDPSE